MDYPPFPEAVARFRRFLNEQGHFGPIAWVYPPDVLLVSDNWLIRARKQEVVLEEIASTYRTATERRLGVKFGVLCLENDRLWCYVYSPEEQIEAEYCMMPDGLKLGVPTEPSQGRSVEHDEWERLRTHDMVERKRMMFT